MWPNPRETADLVTFTEKISNGKLYFSWAVKEASKKSLTTWRTWGFFVLGIWSFLLDQPIKALYRTLISIGSRTATSVYCCNTITITVATVTTTITVVVSTTFQKWLVTPIMKQIKFYQNRTYSQLTRVKLIKCSWTIAGYGVEAFKKASRRKLVRRNLLRQTIVSQQNHYPFLTTFANIGRNYRYPSRIHGNQTG